MLTQPFRAKFGPYTLLLPEGATLTAVVTRTPPEAFQLADTHWIAVVGRFQFFIHLDALSDLTGLKSFTDGVTKGNVTTPSVSVNGIEGVTHGDYSTSRTWIDWWFKKGDTAICLNLQSLVFPTTAPTDAEIAEHLEIIGSLRFIPDAPHDPMPAGRPLDNAGDDA